MTDPGYVSTTAVKQRLGAYIDNPQTITMRIKAPAGTKGAYVKPFSIWPNEGEVVLSRGTAFRIDSIAARGAAGVDLEVSIIEQGIGIE